MDVPAIWKNYPCEDYFRSPLSKEGHWSEADQLWLIEPAERVEEDKRAEFLQVGRPGVDSIGFGYRKDKPGFWAYYPMEEEFRYLATSVSLFLDGWLSGAIAI
ncbi:MAG TPA: hypothetical protein VKE98_23595 [Gemmataceae bacterium]|nr:hypothetical protein [Gemmataceae bacterium]